MTRDLPGHQWDKSYELAPWRSGLEEQLSYPNLQWSCSLQEQPRDGTMPTDPCHLFSTEAFVQEPKWNVATQGPYVACQIGLLTAS